jgi:hypothetical protein
MTYHHNKSIETAKPGEVYWYEFEVNDETEVFQRDEKNWTVGHIATFHGTLEVRRRNAERFCAAANEGDET